MDDFRATSFGGVPIPPTFRFVGAVFGGIEGIEVGSVKGDFRVVGVVGTENEPVKGFGSATGAGTGGVSGLIGGGIGELGGVGRGAGLSACPVAPLRAVVTGVD